MKSSLCKHYAECGGCNLLHLDYAKTLTDKQARLRKIFSAYRGVEISPVLASSPEHHYRHKVQLPVGRSADGAVVGLLARDRKKIVSQKECYIQHPHLTLLAGVVEKWARDNQFPPYDERTGKGLLRHVLFRRSSRTGEILLALSMLHKLPGEEKGYAKLKSMVQNALKNAEPFPLPGFSPQSKLAGITEIIRKSKGNIVLDGSRKTVFGKNFMEEAIGDVKYSLAIDSFFQTNPYQVTPLYQLVKKHVRSGSHVIDAYAGMGTIGLFVSDAAKSVTCVEQNARAVTAGKEAIQRSGKKNVKILRADAGVYLLHKLKSGQNTGVILDPPREGLTRDGVNGLLKAKTDYIIYVSCDPDSLKRDADLLKRNYFLKSLEPVDMFSFTDHLETVALFLKK